MLRNTAKNTLRQPNTIVVNHVMSNDVGSGIFQSIIKYFRTYSPSSFTHVMSKEPRPGANIYHYHRPNLEKNLLQPAIATAHHDIDDTDRWFRFSNFVHQYKQCTNIVCLNTLQQRRLVELGIDQNRLTVIPHGANAKLLRPRPKSDTSRQIEKINIGIISRRYGRRVKGDAYLFELSKRMDPQKYRFTLMGLDRTTTAYELRKLGFECAAFDHMPYRMIQSVYDEIDVLMMCSLYEGGPANIPEALCTGTPVLTSYVGMAADWIQEGKNGLFLSLDPDIDAALLAQLAKNKFAKFNELSLSAREIPKRPRTWAEVTEQHNQMYRRTIEQSTPTRKLGGRV